MKDFFPVQRGMLGGQLRKLRHDHKWTLGQVSDLCGIELSTLSNWETDHHAPSTHKLGDLLRLAYDLRLYIGPAQKEEGGGDK